MSEGFGKDGKGVIVRETVTKALVTLAANTGIVISGGDIGITLTDDFRILATEYLASLQLATFVAGDGPIELYLANGDLSLADFVESIEATGPLNRNDRDLNEKVMRWSKCLGQIAFVEENAAGGVLLPADGGVGKITPRWTFSKGVGWQWFAYNTGQALTTGATVKIRAKHYGVWVG